MLLHSSFGRVWISISQRFQYPQVSPADLFRYAWGRTNAHPCFYRELVDGLCDCRGDFVPRGGKDRVVELDIGLQELGIDLGAFLHSGQYGVKVGQVADITMTDDFRARVALDLRADLKLSTDTMATIVTAGVLGERYIILQPGFEEAMLKPGETISMTEPALILERVVGQLIHGTDIGE